MKTLIRDGNDAVMVPIPQYPLYSASLALYGGTLVPYYLDEDKEWASTPPTSRCSWTRPGGGKEVRALCVINPGNPTGNALNVDNQKEIVQFCKDEVLLIADEVYQENRLRGGQVVHVLQEGCPRHGPRHPPGLHAVNV